MQPACTDEEFIEIWRELGSPTLVANRLGINVSNVYSRRNAIQSRFKIELPTDDLKKDQASSFLQITSASRLRLQAQSSFLATHTSIQALTG